MNSEQVKVGVIIYVVLFEKQTVLPARVVEKLIRETQEGVVTSLRVNFGIQGRGDMELRATQTEQYVICSTLEQAYQKLLEFYTKLAKRAMQNAEVAQKNLEARAGQAQMSSPAPWQQTQQFPTQQFPTQQPTIQHQPVQHFPDVDQQKQGLQNFNVVDETSYDDAYGDEMEDDPAYKAYEELQRKIEAKMLAEAAPKSVNDIKEIKEAAKKQQQKKNTVIEKQKTSSV